MPGRNRKHSSISLMIEDQVGRWRADEQKRQTAGLHGRPWPVITISRQFGSRGAALGKRIAELSGFSFWDRELVQRIAGRSGAAEALMGALDERGRSRIEEILESATMPGESPSQRYFRQLKQVVHTIDRHGAAVIVGRGADSIVDQDRALRVRVICPLELRIGRVVQREGVSERNAKALIGERDRDRAYFVKQRFGQDITDVNNWDLLINTAVFEAGAAAEIVLAAYEQRFGGRPKA